MIERLDAIERRYVELEHLLADPDVASNLERLQEVSKERAFIEDIVRLLREHRYILKEQEETRGLLGENDMADLARDELQYLDQRQSELIQALQLALVPRDPSDSKDVIVEIRAGTGGEEASLFASDLYRMYGRYAEDQRWQISIMQTSPTSLGGFKEIVFELRGRGVFSRLKHERGVHRVQRVPVTETAGRVHTSTCTVVVLPVADEVEIKLNPDDLRIDIFHASGAGGQNVNKVATAVRATHIPSGIMAVCQDERSQMRNKQKALAVLRARLLDQAVGDQKREITADRRSQVGGAERAEKIRTYNVPQNRITDHRVNLTIYNLDRIMNGSLDELIDPLLAHEQSQLLSRTD